MENETSGTPQHDLRKKTAAQSRERKRTNKVEEVWYELNHKSASKKGAKVQLVQLMTSGVKYKTLIGFSSECKELLEKAQKAGNVRIK